MNHVMAGHSVVGWVRQAYGVIDSFDGVEYINESTSAKMLVPIVQLNELVPQMQRALEPASVQAAAVLIARLLAPYRAQEYGNQDLAMDLFLETAQRYPEAVLTEAITALHSRLKFAPTIADLTEACEVAVFPVRHRLRIAERMKAEHERRAHKRNKERDINAALERQRAERKEQFEKKFNGTLSIEDYNYAGVGMSAIRNPRLHRIFNTTEFENALLAGKAWALAGYRALALVGRAFAIHSRAAKPSSKLNYDELVAVTKSAISDEQNVRAFLETASARDGTEPGRLQMSNFQDFQNELYLILMQIAKILEYEARAEPMCAIDELKLSGTPDKAISELITAYWLQNPEVVSQVRKLAEANAARDYPPEIRELPLMKKAEGIST